MVSEHDNPYLPTTANDIDLRSVNSVQRKSSEIDATLGQRFANLLIDTVCYYPLGIGLVALLANLGIFLGCRVTGPAIELSAQVISLLIVVGYYVFLESMFGASIGKLVTGTRVVRSDGSRPRFRQIVGGNYCSIIPVEPFSVFIARGRVPCPWHDSISGTRVFRRNAADSNSSPHSR